MTNRAIIATAIGVVSAVSVAVGLAESGRLTVLSQTWDRVTVAGSALLHSPDAASSAPADGGITVAVATPSPRRQAAALSSAQLGAPLVHGTFVSACGAPETMKVVVKASVRMGHAIDVKVKTDPSSSSVASCIERATRELQWDISPKLNHVTVTY